MRTIASVIGITVLGGGLWGTHAAAQRAGVEPAWTGQSRPAQRLAASDSPTAPVAAPARRLDVIRLLRARQFATLTRAIEAKQSNVERDIRREDDLAAVIGSFDAADAEMTPLLDEWIAAAPDSFAPPLARAVHRVALAWDRRSAKYANKTSEEQFAGMEAFLEAAIEDARAVIKLNPRVGEAHRVLIKAAMALGDPETCARVATLGIAGLPASMRVRTALATCFLPRWGGSYRLVEALATEGDEHVKDNPALAALHGFVDWDQGNLAAPGSDQEMEHYDRAVEAGAFWLFYRDRALAHLHKQHYFEALEDTSRALALAPDEPDTLTIRVCALKWLGRHIDAVAVVRVIEEVDPTNSAFVAFRRRELKEGAVEAYQLYSANDHRGAIARLTRAMDLAGGDVEVHYWRGRAYLKIEDRDHALADFEAAIRLDARHFESYRNVDFILAGRGEWDRIIRYWTRYIEAEPTDGRAYFERGGAKYRKGDRAAALEDARKGCELGAKDACDYVHRSTNQ